MGSALEGQEVPHLIPVTLVTMELPENKAPVLFLEMTQVQVGAPSVAGRDNGNPSIACWDALGGEGI